MNGQKVRGHLLLHLKMENLNESISQIEGRIHFAGEHASNDRGWMQGALFSGLRAATEIKNNN